MRRTRRTLNYVANDGSEPLPQRRRTLGGAVAVPAAVSLPAQLGLNARRQRRAIAAADSDDDDDYNIFRSDNDEPSSDGEQEMHAMRIRSMAAMSNGAVVAHNVRLLTPMTIFDSEIEDEDDEDEDVVDDRDSDETDEDEADEDDEEYGDINGGAGIAVFAGGDDWDVVLGGNIGVPLRATGTLPARQPGDVLITRGVWARETPDRHHILLGPALANCPKLLTRILKMRQQPGQLLWKSELALTASEWQYIKGVFGNPRIQPLLQRGERVMAPLPNEGFPARFRLADASGRALSGPKITRGSGKPWNVGRQYFSSFATGGDMTSFIWADGVRAMEPEAQASFNNSMIGAAMFG